MSAPSPAKLAELRARTDRQLPAAILGELDRALPLAKAAANRQSPLYAKAEKAYLKVKPLVSKVEAVSAEQRALLDLRVAEIELALAKAVSKSKQQEA